MGFKFSSILRVYYFMRILSLKLVINVGCIAANKTAHANAIKEGATACSSHSDGTGAGCIGNSINFSAQPVNDHGGRSGRSEVVITVRLADRPTERRPSFIVPWTGQH